GEGEGEGVEGGDGEDEGEDEGEGRRAAEPRQDADGEADGDADQHEAERGPLKDLDQPGQRSADELGYRRMPLSLAATSGSSLKSSATRRSVSSPPMGSISGLARPASAGNSGSRRVSRNAL